MRQEEGGIVFDESSEIRDVKAVINAFLSEHREEIDEHNSEVDLNRQREEAGLQVQPLPELDESITVASAIIRRLGSTALAVNNTEARLIANCFEASAQVRAKDRKQHSRPHISPSASRSHSILVNPDMQSYDRHTKRHEAVAREIRELISDSGEI